MYALIEQVEKKRQQILANKKVVEDKAQELKKALTEKREEIASKYDEGLTESYKALEDYKKGFVEVLTSRYPNIPLEEITTCNIPQTLLGGNAGMRGCSVVTATINKIVEGFLDPQPKEVVVKRVVDVSNPYAYRMSRLKEEAQLRQQKVRDELVEEHKKALAVNEENLNTDADDHNKDLLDKDEKLPKLSSRLNDLYAKARKGKKEVVNEETATPDGVVGEVAVVDKAENPVDKAVNEGFINWEVMPESEVGAGFAFKAIVDSEDAMEKILNANSLKFDKVIDPKTDVDVWLIGYEDNDHIATYVPEDKILYTDDREAFRLKPEEVNESVEDVKKVLQNNLSADGNNLDVSKELPKDLKILSGTAGFSKQAGEVEYKGKKYAYLIKDGNVKVMDSDEAGSNWSETLYKESCKVDEADKTPADDGEDAAKDEIQVVGTIKELYKVIKEIRDEGPTAWKRLSYYRDKLYDKLADLNVPSVSKYVSEHPDLFDKDVYDVLVDSVDRAGKVEEDHKGEFGNKLSAKDIKDTLGQLVDSEYDQDVKAELLDAIKKAYDLVKEPAND